MKPPGVPIGVEYRPLVGAPLAFAVLYRDDPQHGDSRHAAGLVECATRRAVDQALVAGESEDVGAKALSAAASATTALLNSARLISSPLIT